MFQNPQKPHLPALLLFLSAAALAQQPTAPIVPPGAPGQSSKILSPSSVAAPPTANLEADITFMQGMIMHHSQAVDMTAMMPSRTRNKALLELGRRISISQSGEIKWMKDWLQDRGQPTTMEPPMAPMAGMDMGPMDHMNMEPAPMMMPGMLTPQQMKALRASSGPRFDHLFLTGMIQHHTGALTMVQELFSAGGAEQDNLMFDFATDIDNTQSAEIKIMQAMLLREKTPQEKK
jgi:uncharacterized protein (DUF305 family)